MNFYNLEKGYFVIAAEHDASDKPVFELIQRSRPEEARHGMHSEARQAELLRQTGRRSGSGSRWRRLHKNRLMPAQAGATAVGIAHCAFAERLVIEQPGIVDYVEIPFEQLVHNPRSAELAAHVPLIPHRASLSMAGNVSPDRRLVESVHHWMRETKTPWIGEHLSNVRADGTWKEIAEHSALFMGEADQGPAGPFNVGYTVSPQYSHPVLDRVHEAWASFERKFGIPILLENGPIYFNMPGSTMSQSTFVT